MTQDEPLGYVFVSEVYNVTWRVPESEAKEFVQKRKSKKEEFARHQQSEEGHKPERVEQKVQQHGGAEGGDLGSGSRGFEDIGATGSESDQSKFQKQHDERSSEEEKKR